MNWISVLDYFIKCYHSPIWFYYDVTKYMRKIGKHIHPTKTQSLFLLEFTRSSDDWFILSANRGGGKTLTLAIAVLWSLLVYPIVNNRLYQVVIVSGSKDQSMELFNYIRDVVSSHPIINQYIEKSLNDIIVFKDGSYVKALPKSLTATASKHVDLLIIDEAVYINQDVYNTILPLIITGSGHSKLIVCSTADEQGEGIFLFLKLWNNYKEYGFKYRYNWGINECYWISKDTINKLKMQYGEGSVGYTTKVLGIPLYIGNSIFSFEDVRRCMRDIPVPKADSFEGIYLGVDWGYTDEAVFTVVGVIADYYVVLHVEGYQYMEFSRQKDIVKKLYKEYNVKEIYADSNRLSLIQDLVREGYPVKAVYFNKDKESLLMSLRSMISNHKISIPKEFIKLKEQLLKYHEGMRGGDDYVDSLLCAVYSSIRNIREYNESNIVLPSFVNRY